MKSRLAVAQMTSRSDKLENLDQMASLIRKARDAGVDMLCFPENFVFFGESSKDSLAIAEPLTGPTLKLISRWARENGIWLSLGGFQERIEGEGKIYNSHLIVDDSGEIAATYRKIHLFSAQLPDGSSYGEDVAVRPGESVVVCDSPYGKLGLTICYDLRFFDLFGELRELGAQIILVPAAFTTITGAAHWEVLLRARAIETQCYVVAAAQVGIHNRVRSTYGHGMIIDPWGRVLARCGENDDVVFADIDLSSLKKIREQMPVWQHRRLNKL